MLWLALSGVVSLTSAQTPNVEGTRWVFPPGVQPKPIVVSFRADGVAEFSELKSTGHWKQSGDVVVFDANDFTEYRVVVRGNEMKGTWVRLRGAQKGKTAATELKKL
jgi:hypothetical protein